MMIGPEPMMRILWISVRFGMGFSNRDAKVVVDGEKHCLHVSSYGASW